MLLFVERRQRWLLLGLTLFTFFTLLGSRALNEPDEGRYAEIAREMVESGDWVIPRLWYLPHLDKPPMTYWLVAASIKSFGQNEWAVRLPLALAGIGGIWGTFLLGCAVGGRRTGIWAALILQSSLLYFIMARMLTTDLFLTLFTVWAMYFFWRSWQCLADPEKPGTKFFGWHLAGWTCLAGGFLTKGPIAPAIPAVAFGVVWFFRRREAWSRKKLLAGVSAGFIWFLVLSAPWFLLVFQREPGAAHYMILGQVAGHLLGTTIKNRSGSPFYFFGVLAFGLLPWTLLLGWLWRRGHWQGLSDRAKDAWLVLNGWAIFTFALFSLSHSKLAAYILPIFPALAVLLAWRFFADETTDKWAPAWVRRSCTAVALLLPAVFPLILMFVFKDTLPPWLKWQTPVALVLAVMLFWLAREWNWRTAAVFSAVLAVLGLLATAAELPRFETTLHGNQTLQPLAQALRQNFQTDDPVVCWYRLPEGLPFYAGGVFSPTNQPYFCGIVGNQMPFDYPDNRKLAGDHLLPDENALAALLQGHHHVLVVGPGDTMEKVQDKYHNLNWHLIARSGEWALYSN